MSASDDAERERERAARNHGPNGDGRQLAALLQRAAEHERRLSTNEARMERYGESLQQLLPLVAEMQWLRELVAQVREECRRRDERDVARREWEDGFRVDLRRFQHEKTRDLRGSVIAVFAVCVTLFGILVSGAVQILIRLVGR